MITSEFFALIYEPSQKRNENSLITEMKIRQSEAIDETIFHNKRISVQVDHTLLKNFVGINNCTGLLDATG